MSTQPDKLPAPEVVIETDNWLKVAQNASLSRSELEGYDEGEPLKVPVKGVGTVAFLPGSSKIEHMPDRKFLEGGVLLGERSGNATLIVRRRPIFKKFTSWVTGKEAEYPARATLDIQK